MFKVMGKKYLQFYAENFCLSKRVTEKHHNLQRFYLAIFKALYESHSQSKNGLYFPISCILALIFPILLRYFPKCEGKGSFLKSQIKSLI